MHPLFARPIRFALYLLLWTIAGFALAVIFRGSNRLGETAVLYVPLTAGFGLVALSPWWICRVFPLERAARVWRVVVVQVVAGLVAAIAWTFVGDGWAGAIAMAPGGSGAYALYATHRPVLFAIYLLVFWLAVVVWYLVMAFEASREAERVALELNVLARESELKALRAQIDPHFIFNSLHSISALTTADPAAARRMCILLADFLRETLRLGSKSQISLAEELALAERFLSVEQVRLGTRLRVAQEAAAEVVTCLVPPLLLQPLVQNAVVHGVSQLIDGGTVTLHAARVDVDVVVTVENPCDPDRRRTQGIGLGLDLLRQRLMAQFGSRGSVQALERDGHFRVEVRFPALVGR